MRWAVEGEGRDEEEEDDDDADAADDDGKEELAMFRPGGVAGEMFKMCFDFFLSLPEQVSFFTSPSLRLDPLSLLLPVVACSSSHRGHISNRSHTCIAR